MTTINHEAYCGQDLINLLLKAGFDWQDYFVAHFIDEHFHWEIPLHIAQKWLREVKDTIIDINSSYLPKGYGVSYCVHWKEPNKMMQAIGKSETSSFYKMFDTHEEAQEAGIKKALEIILEKGE